MSVGDLREYEVWGKLDVHRRHLIEARNALRKIAGCGRLMISTSWGKDSIALCDLAVDVLGQGVTLVHFAASYALPGNEAVIAHFAARANVVTVEAARTLDDTISWLRDIGGLGYERTTTAGAGKRSKTSRAVAWAVAHGYEAQALGMRAEEAAGRRMNFRVRGLVYPAHGMWIANPLGWWTVKDVWAHIVVRGLPYNRRIYDAETHGYTRETLRNAGWLSLAGHDDAKAQWLQRHFPEEFHRLRAAFPRIGFLL